MLSNTSYPKSWLFADGENKEAQILLSDGCVIEQPTRFEGILFNFAIVLKRE